jgi:hypothetical protein
MISARATEQKRDPRRGERVVHLVDFTSMCPTEVLRLSAFFRILTQRLGVPFLLAVLLAGCAQMAARPGAEPPPRPSAPPIAPNVEPPAPKINLSGFPLEYRQGYADGCASATGAERKDATRFAGDGNYRTGWQDGIALCRKK